MEFQGQLVAGCELGGVLRMQVVFHVMGWRVSRGRRWREKGCED